MDITKQLNELPREILENIFKTLDDKQLINLKKSCKYFEEIIDSQSFKLLYCKNDSVFLNLNFISCKFIDVDLILINNSVFVGHMGKIKLEYDPSSKEFSKLHFAKISTKQLKKNTMAWDQRYNIDCINVVLNSSICNDEFSCDYHRKKYFIASGFDDHIYKIDHDALYKIDIKDLNNPTTELVSVQRNCNGLGVLSYVMLKNNILCSIGFNRENYILLFTDIHSKKTLCVKDTKISSFKLEVKGLYYIEDKLIVLYSCSELVLKYDDINRIEEDDRNSPGIYIYDIVFSEEISDNLSCEFLKSCSLLKNSCNNYININKKCKDSDEKQQQKICYTPEKIVYNSTYLCVIMKLRQFFKSEKNEYIKAVVFDSKKFDYLHSISIPHHFKERTYLKKSEIYEKYLINMYGDFYGEFMDITNLDNGTNKILQNFTEKYKMLDFVIFKKKHKYYLIILVRIIELKKNIVVSYTLHVDNKESMSEDTPMDIESLLKELSDEFTCPISHEIFVDPVRADDDFFYEKDSIEKWFKENNTSPITRKVVKGKELKRNVHFNKLLGIFKKYKK